jgi:hypothetical protein
MVASAWSRIEAQQAAAEKATARAVKPKPKRKPVAKQTKELTKRELYAMLANAVRNTS